MINWTLIFIFLAFDQLSLPLYYKLALGRSAMRYWGGVLTLNILLVPVRFELNNNYYVWDWFVKISFVLVYVFVGFWIFFTSSLWLLYFGLELQWMLFIIFFVIGNTVWKGLINYVIFNELVGTLLILGLILYINIFFSSLYYGKIGFYPFMIPMVGIILNSSYLYLLFDPLNKFLYFGAYISYENYFSVYSQDSVSLFMILLINFYMIYVFGIKFIHSIKIVLLVSSLINFLLIIILALSAKALLFSFVYFFVYFTILFVFISSIILFFSN